MWLPITFASLGLTGSVFMLWFLRGLCRDKRHSNRYWILIRREVEEKAPSTVNGNRANQASPAGTKIEGDCAKVLENKNHGKERASSLIAVDVRVDDVRVDLRPSSARLRWRSVHSGKFHALPERRF